MKTAELFELSIDLNGYQGNITFDKEPLFCLKSCDTYKFEISSGIHQIDTGTSAEGIE